MAPVELGTTVLPEVIREFHKQYLKVNLELLLSDKTIDLVSEGVDLAIRAGELKDSSLISKKLGSVYFAPFASPKYLRKNGSPKAPQDLKNHCCIGFVPLGSHEWELFGSKGAQTISMVQQIVTNDLDLIKALAVSGAGIGLLPTFLCHNEVDDEMLIRVLGDWRSRLSPVHFVYSPQKFVPPKMRAFITVATDLIRKRLAEFQF